MSDTVVPDQGSAPARASAAPTERVHVTRSRAKPGGTAQADGAIPFKRARKPPWLKVPAPGGPNYRRLKEKIGNDNLHTVCEEANCPNVGECWERGTATFMILGDVCTRRCGFCNVQTGKPTWNDPLEPLRVANQVKAMGLRHAVVTSVDRDDLPDYGASAFVGVVRSIRMMAPDCKVEILTPDFRGQEMPLAKVIHEKPDVFNHNVETVPRLYPIARRGSQFARSARVLRMAKEMGGDDVVTKSGLMVGLGESFEEMVETFGLLREHRVQVLTVGQYLRPTENHLPVVRYWHPDEFAALEKAAYDLGFESVAAGPLVRSSYHADQNLPDRQARREPAGLLAVAPPPVRAGVRSRLLPVDDPPRCSGVAVAGHRCTVRAHDRASRGCAAACEVGDRLEPLRSTRRLVFSAAAWPDRVSPSRSSDRPEESSGDPARAPAMTGAMHVDRRGDVADGSCRLRGATLVPACVRPACSTTIVAECSTSVDRCR